jgi:hypothetical protein
VLRRGIELLGLKQPVELAEYKPALAMNALQCAIMCHKVRGLP